jgi:DNA-directed RNA polymerase specialized sigma24 family protein
MQSITIASSERKDLIQKLKRQRQLSRRLRMHIVLLAADAYSPTEIARVLFCSRTTFIRSSLASSGEACGL